MASQIISFSQFRENYPDGKVLSRNTGYNRNYGNNPYTGYDGSNNTPLFGAGNDDGRLPSMEKVIGVTLNDQRKAYPYSITHEKQVINDDIGNSPLLIIHTDGATSAVDAARIGESRESGSTGVFKHTLEDQKLSFFVKEGYIIDKQTRYGPLRATL
ncbi:Protein of unknown function [Fodinibius sediminis]|uniref:Uncharacterized protein n=1 Tax=Fodinibius sediminis TaxID=1214077 RepID=A0A521CKJ6_9BACT|nr:Protein of unknown function [Fodinibius sediminis]